MVLFIREYNSRDILGDFETCGAKVVSQRQPPNRQRRSHHISSVHSFRIDQGDTLLFFHHGQALSLHPNGDTITLEAAIDFPVPEIQAFVLFCGCHARTCLSFGNFSHA